MAKMNHSNDFKTKIVLVNVSQFLRELLLRVFRKVSDFEIVGIVNDLAGLKTLLSTVEADWLVTSVESKSDVLEMMKTLDSRYPDISLLVIAADGSEFLIRDMVLQEVHMEEASLPELITLMKEHRQHVSG